MSPNIISSPPMKHSNGSCEQLIAELNELDVTTIVIYRPPDATLEEFNDVLAKAADYLDNHPSKDIRVAGDFNLGPEVVSWKLNDGNCVPAPTTFRSDSRKDQFQRLIHFTHEFFGPPTKEGLDLEIQSRSFVRSFVRSFDPA